MRKGLYDPSAELFFVMAWNSGTVSRTRRLRRDAGRLRRAYETSFRMINGGEINFAPRDAEHALNTGFVLPEECSNYFDPLSYAARRNRWSFL